MTGREFDFYRHVHGILKERYRASFVPYHEVYSYLGRRFCMKKQEVKELIRSIEGRGYLAMKKRGILLIEKGSVEGERNGDEASSGSEPPDGLTTKIRKSQLNS